jgi:diguanylate cyclase (GGDEF)-like protein
MAEYDPLRSRQIRVLAFGVLALLWIAEGIMLAVRPPFQVAAMASYTFTYFAPVWLAMLGCFIAAVRTRGVERRFWTLLGTTMAGLAPTEMYWMYYQTYVNSHGPQMPHWAELGHLVAILSMYALVVSMTEHSEQLSYALVRAYCDTLATILVVWVLLYWFWTLPLYLHVPRGGVAVGAIITFYPVTGLVMLTISALIVYGWRADQWRSWERLVASFLTLFGAGLIIAPPMNAAWMASSVLAVTDVNSMVFGVGISALFLASVYRLTAPPGGARVKPWPLPKILPGWLSVLYPSGLSLALVAIGLLSLRVFDQPGGALVVIVTAGLAVILVVRSWASSMELATHKTRSITDRSTGAYNQRQLYEALPGELAEAHANNRCMSVVAFDIVDFRDLAVMSGQAEADRVLGELADVLRVEAPTGSSVYRVGLDEFLVTIPGFSAEDTEGLARRVNAAVTRRISVGGVPIALSAGAARFPEDGRDAAALVSRALAAQELARSAERVDVVVYDAEVVDAADSLARLDRARKRSHRAKLRALAAAVDARDADSRFHSEVVAEIASAFALLLELSDETTQLLETSALVHDLGKIAIPDQILLKPGPLTREERAVVEEHPALSERLLAPADMPEVLPIVRHHHERWDGSGYPDGLAGSAIPFEARILAICDAFDAMTTNRRYRPALTTVQALQELERCSGTQFDPKLVAQFSSMVVALHGRALSHRLEITRRELGLEAANTAS